MALQAEPRAGSQLPTLLHGRSRQLMIRVPLLRAGSAQFRADEGKRHGTVPAVDHPMTESNHMDPGLSSAQVAAAVAAGHTNATVALGRRTRDIVRDNVVTRFNAVLGTLFVIAIVVAPPQDALFGFVIIANGAIGIAQEVRAKRTLDRLTVLTMPKAAVRRDDVEQQIGLAEIVLGDHVLLRTGDQIPVDGTLLAADQFEVDESLLTGESEPRVKAAGDAVRSGSVVTAGAGTLVAEAVGNDAYAQRLTVDARRYAVVTSEIRSGVDRILQVLGWLLVPVGALTVFGQFRVEPTTRDALAGTVAALVGMVPEGLVLLTSVAFAAGVMRMSARGALVQELAALEGLARVDTVCLDKTGTLTEAAMRVASVIRLARPDGQDCGEVLGALAAAEPSPNASTRAIATEFPAPGWTTTRRAAFTSARRWSGSTFEQHGTFVLGAPSALLNRGGPSEGDPSPDEEITNIIEREAAAGHRTLVLAQVKGELIAGPNGEVPPCTPICVVALREKVRPDAEAMIRFFTDSHVTTLVLSGDDPRTVASVATAVGVPGAEHPASGADLPTDSAGIVAFVEAHRVVGRVAPEQKLAIVKALQERGHGVAMTGDGVNDVPALKQADISVAMRTGSGAARAVARVVMAGDSFAPLPELVREGRRVLANMERVASLFLTKTVYAIMLAIMVTVARLPYPLLPRQLTLISTLTIGLPGFLLSLLPTNAMPHHRLVARAMRQAVPAGVLTAGGVVASYTAVRAGSYSESTERSAALVTALLCGLVVLALAAAPLDLARRAIVAFGFGCALLVFATPPLRRLLAIEVPRSWPAVTTVASSIVACAAIIVSWRWSERAER